MDTGPRQAHSLKVDKLVDTGTIPEDGLKAPKEDFIHRKLVANGAKEL